MNRYPALMPLCCALLLGVMIALLGGCQRSTGAPGAPTQAQDENARLREALERTGQTMDQLAEQVERQQSREAQKAGDPPVVRDLAVARATLSEAQKLAAAAKDADATRAALARLRRVLQSIAAELPAATIAQYADRALYRINALVAVGSEQFADASLELIAAYDAANNGRPAELVPAVTNDLDSAIKALKKGDTASAIQTLNSVIAKATDHASVKVLAQAQVAAHGAETALARGAWPVVSAELAELESQLSQIVVAQPTVERAPAASQPTEQAAPATGAATGQQPAASTTPSATGTPQQATPPTPGATPQQPAATPPATR